MPTPNIEIVATITTSGGMAQDGNSRLLWPDHAIDAPNRRTMNRAPKAIAAVTFNSMRAARMPVYDSQRNYVIGSPDDAPDVGRYFDHMLVPSIERAIDLVRTEGLKRFFLIGDAAFYVVALPYTQELHLTTVEGEFPTSDYFPDFTNDFEPNTMIRPLSQTSNGVNFTNQSYIRKKYK